MVNDNPAQLYPFGDDDSSVELTPGQLARKSSTLSAHVPRSPPSNVPTLQNPAIPPRINTSLGNSTSIPRPKRKDPILSFQEAVNESLQETQRLREARILEDPGSPQSSANMIMDTVREIRTAASGTIASLREWAQNQNLDVDLRLIPTTKSDDRQDFMVPWPRPPPSPLMRATEEAMPQRTSTSNHSKKFDFDSQNQRRTDTQALQKGTKNTLLQDLAWPFMACGAGMTENFPNRDEIVPHIRKVKDAVSKAVNGDIKAANDIWRFATNHDDDNASVQSFDTLQEENNQIRRLASWGTANTSGTGGTYDTGINSLGTEVTPKEIRIGVADDDGNAIDPYLLEKTQKTMEKRRRRKIVKFDYPPIKSLRQCPRPNPEDLPELFFTEHELDQIEDDRYSTMSTDDVEIVAVASKNSDQSEPLPAKFNNYAGTPKGKRSPAFPEGVPPGTSSGRDPPESGWKTPKGRPSTPYRGRQNDNDSTHSATVRSSGGEKRLVRGVQIYLRERSTGA